MRGIRLRAIAVCLLFVAGCAANPSGSVTLGMKGSPAWHQFASASDIEAYYDAMEPFELCQKWDRAIEKPNTDVIRSAIGRALIRRGENPERCYNPEADAIRAAAELSKPSRPVTIYQPPRVYVPQTQTPPMYGVDNTVRCIGRQRMTGDVKVVCR